MRHKGCFVDTSAFDLPIISCYWSTKAFEEADITNYMVLEYSVTKCIYDMMRQLPKVNLNQVYIDSLLTWLVVYTSVSIFQTRILL